MNAAPCRHLTEKGRGWRRSLHPYNTGQLETLRQLVKLWAVPLRPREREKENNKDRRQGLSQQAEQQSHLSDPQKLVHPRLRLPASPELR